MRSILRDLLTAKFPPDVEEREFWRRYYAGCALTGALAANLSPRDAVPEAFKIAEAMLKQLDKVE